MRIQIQLRILDDDNAVISDDEILSPDKGDDRLETIGLSLDEAKSVLAGLQERIVTAQAASHAARHRATVLPAAAACGAKDTRGSSFAQPLVPFLSTARAFITAASAGRPSARPPSAP